MINSLRWCMCALSSGGLWFEPHSGCLCWWNDSLGFWWWRLWKTRAGQFHSQVFTSGTHCGTVSYTAPTLRCSSVELILEHAFFSDCNVLCYVTLFSILNSLESGCAVWNWHQESGLWNTVLCGLNQRRQSVYIRPRYATFSFYWFLCDNNYCWNN